MLIRVEYITSLHLLRSPNSCLNYRKANHVRISEKWDTTFSNDWMGQWLWKPFFCPMWNAINYFATDVSKTINKRHGYDNVILRSWVPANVTIRAKNSIINLNLSLVCKTKYFKTHFSNKDESYLELKNLWIKDIISIISIETISKNSTSIESLQKIY